MEDATLLEQFESTTFPVCDWHHREHIKIAYLYLQRHGLTAAMDILRAGIKRYNAANGITDGPTGGYHETMTRFWLELINFTVLTQGAAETADEFVNKNPQLLEQKITRFFYSRERFMSAAAKETCLTPNLTPLPRTIVI